MRVETIGAATLYLGDCREILPTIAGDAILSDPPYGQNANTNVMGTGGVKVCTPPRCGAPAIERAQRQRAAAASGALEGGPLRTAKVWPAIVGDANPFDPSDLLKAAPKVLLWGAHKFGHRLPKGRTLVWDKVPTGKVRDQGDGETAWTNVNPDAVVRIYRLLWDGVCVGSAGRADISEGRLHPTQKPESLMAWCLAFLELQPGSLVVDPYMGSGSAGVAAVKAGYRFVGIELEPLYFDTACRRIEEAQRQADMFVGAAA